MILILILYMLLASTFTLGKAALEYVQPIFFIGIRMVIGGSLLLGYTYICKRSWWQLHKKHLSLFIQIIFFHIYLAYVLEYVGLQQISSARVCLLYNLSPFITALLAYFFFTERLSLIQWIGLLIGFLGFIPMLLTSCDLHDVIPPYLYVSFPEMLIFGSVAAASYGWIVMKRLGQEGYSPVMVNGIGMFFGGILALITSNIVGESPLFISNVGIGCSWQLLIVYTALLILIANIIFYNLYGFLLRRYSPTYLSFVGFTCPLFAALYGALFLHETVSGWFFVTVGIVTLGLYLFYQDDLKGGAQTK